MPPVKSIYVYKPTHGRRFAISDIHGCSKTFKKLLKKIDLQKEDQLFLVGDLINRGPKSNKVLNRVLKLKAKGFQVYFIRGNHEQMILNSSKKRTGQRKRQFKNLKSSCLLEDGELCKNYKSLLQDAYHFIETEDYFLVHAGFNHEAKHPLKDSYAMMNIRKFQIKNKITKGKSIIIGHTPKSLEFIQEHLTQKKIYIDNGCVNFDTTGQGNLVCFDLDHRSIIYQKNKDV